MINKDVSEWRVGDLVRAKHDSKYSAGNPADWWRRGDVFKIYQIKINIDTTSKYIYNVYGEVISGHSSIPRTHIRGLQFGLIIKTNSFINLRIRKEKENMKKNLKFIEML